MDETSAVESASEPPGHAKDLTVELDVAEVMRALGEAMMGTLSCAFGFDIDAWFLPPMRCLGWSTLSK